MHPNLQIKHNVDTVSSNSVKAQMPHPTLTRVKGGPTHKQVKMVLRELTANLMVVSCSWGHTKGHLGQHKDPAIYLARNGALFDVPTAKPPAYPFVPARATAPQCEELRATNAAACKAWMTYCLVLSITRNQFTAAIINVTTPYWTIQLRVSMASICIRSSHTS